MLSDTYVRACLYVQVLENPNKGLVLSVDARFHSNIASLTQKQLKKLNIQQQSISSLSFPILVYTPQRQSYATLYTATAKPTSSPSSSSSPCIFTLTKSSEGELNPFVVHTVEFTLFIISCILSSTQFQEKVKTGIAIHLYGDHQFYSATPPQNNVKTQL